MWFSGSSYAEFFFVIFPKVAVKCVLTVKPRLYGVKSSRVELRVTHLSYKSWRTVYMTNKKLVRLIGRLARSTFFYCEVNLLAGPVFLQINPFSRPAVQIGQGETIRACASIAGSGKEVNFFRNKLSLGAGRVTCFHSRQPSSDPLPLLTYLDVSDPPYFHVSGASATLFSLDKIKENRYLKFVLLRI